MKNLRDFIALLREHDEIVDVFHEVDTNLEIAEIHRCVAAADGPALFFRRVKGSSFPVVTNLFGSRKRIDLAFHNRPHETLARLVEIMTAPFPPKLRTLWQNRSYLKKINTLGTKKQSFSPVKEVRMSDPDLEKLPMLKSWPLDGGHFLTLPLVYTEGKTPNLGMYRVQRFGPKHAGLHFQIQKGGGFHFYQAEQQNCPLPVNIFLGGPPALILSAITPLPENVSELLVAGLLQGEKLGIGSSEENSYPLISESEFALIGEAPPHVRHPEGPFGDHYGYYSWKHDFPLFQLKAIYHRKDAIFPATVVGKPRQEDFYIGDYLQQLLSPIFPIVMPAVKALWSYGETGFHALSAAIVHERYERECMASAFRILGEGQLSLTKFLLLTDQNINLRNFRELFTTVLERFQPEKDLFIFANLSLDTLDYTGPSLNKGSRGVLLGIGKKVRDLPTTFVAQNARPFCPGCLVIENERIETIVENPAFADWPLVILVDSAEKTLSSEASFLWTVFTRFEPAQDIYSKGNKVHRHHILYSLPIVIDARMKPSYPEEVLCDPETERWVTEHWKKYFPQGMEKGNSKNGHV
ncbi:MAG: UbiD family decarboxylase [Chlamydiales bacterium]